MATTPSLTKPVKSKAVGFSGGEIEFEACVQSAAVCVVVGSVKL